MNLLNRLGPSLILTALVAFSIPVTLVLAMLGLLQLVGYLPGCEWVSLMAITQVWQFLTIFGGGSPLDGVMTIGFTFAFVGGLFDLFNFYRYQTLKGN